MTTSSKTKGKPIVTLVYVGPSNKIIDSNAVYSNGIPKNISENFKECPSLEKLFVPIDNLVDAQKQLNDKETALSLFYNKAKQYFEGVK